ncbi:hypothetical protein C0J08_03350 [Marinomonas sp. CT5]|uniref:hypothetical protein n=1 Tax=Marinomonas sp. CT5 TaxID=2066133 RepID=UPI001BAE685A|nr:hypothetical protein [Marinomonas sp. CT5]QUX94506.1 hypothetical protein C0J08_03350 [Marinomonas sp. CT5]
MNKDIIDKANSFGLISLISKKFQVSEKSVYGYLYNLTDHAPDSILWGRKIIFSFLFFILLPFAFLTRKNKRNKEKVDVVFNIWNYNIRKNSYNQYYLSLDDILKKEGVKTKLYINKAPQNAFLEYGDYISSDYVDKKNFVFRFLSVFFDFKFFFKIIGFSLKENVNFLYLFVRFFIGYIKIISFCKNINSSVYCSANDIEAYLLLHEILKKNNVKYILIQSSLREQYHLLYKGADYVCCYSENQRNMYMHESNDFKNVVSCGSIKNLEFLNKKVPVKYDVMLVEQFADRSGFAYASNEAYVDILKNYIRFSKEFPEYSFAYRVRPEKREERRHIKLYDSIFEELEQSKIILDSEGSSYEAVKSSRLVIGYFSTLCFESIGLGVPALFFYYDDFKYEIFDYNNSSDDFLVTDSSYEIFKASILKKLKENNNEYFEKYKPIYMNQKESVVDDLLDEIRFHIN